MTPEEFDALRKKAEAGDGEALAQCLDEVRRILEAKRAELDRQSEIDRIKKVAEATTQEEFNALVARMKSGDEEATRILAEIMHYGGGVPHLDTCQVKPAYRVRIAKFDGDYSDDKDPVEIVEATHESLF